MEHHARLPAGLAGMDGRQKDNTMLVFLDTEFTKFAHPDLISLALVAEDGREFYAERTDYRNNECSGFVQETVLPLLGRVPGAACNSRELTDRVRAWFAALPEPATVIFDFKTDWHLLAVAMLGRPKKNHQQVLLRSFFWTATPSHTRLLSKRKTSSTPKTAPRTMRWPMRGRSWRATGRGVQAWKRFGKSNDHLQPLRVGEQRRILGAVQVPAPHLAS